MSKMELKEVMNVAKGLDKEEQKVFVSCFDTQLLVDELNRRTNALESLYLDLCNELATVGKNTTTQDMEKVVAKLRSLLRIPVE